MSGLNIKSDGALPIQRFGAGTPADGWVLTMRGNLGFFEWRPFSGTTGSGTSNFLPLWTSSTVLGSSPFSLGGSSELNLNTHGLIGVTAITFTNTSQFLDQPSSTELRLGANANIYSTINGDNKLKVSSDGVYIVNTGTNNLNFPSSGTFAIVNPSGINFRTGVATSITGGSSSTQRIQWESGGSLSIYGSSGQRYEFAAAGDQLFLSNSTFSITCTGDLSLQRSGTTHIRTSANGVDLNNKAIENSSDVQMNTRASAPGNTNTIYVKSVSGVSRLFFEDDGGTEHQIT